MHIAIRPTWGWPKVSNIAPKYGDNTTHNNAVCQRRMYGSGGLCLLNIFKICTHPFYVSYSL